MRGALWWIGLTVFFVLAVVLRRSAMTVFVLILALASALSALWARYSLANVTYRRRLADPQIGYGEETQLILEFTNAKPLPLAWLMVYDRFPRQLELLTDDVLTTDSVQSALLTTLLSLRWYERVTHTHRVHGTRRGRFRLGPAQLVSGDVFGFRRSERWDSGADYLVVYPRVVPVEALGVPTNRPLGEWLGRRRVIEDPMRFASVREYVPGDVPRSIHWKASAHTGTLQTKMFEPSDTLSLILAVDVQTLLYGYSYLPDHLEFVITAAASLAVHALNERYSVGLYANGIGPQGERIVRVPPGRHPQQMSILLTQLAGLTSFRGPAFYQMLHELKLELPFGASVVAITSIPEEAVYEALTAMEDMGHPVMLVTVGDVGGDVPDRLRTFHLGGRDVWQGLEALELA